MIEKNTHHIKPECISEIVTLIVLVAYSLFIEKMLRDFDYSKNITLGFFLLVIPAYFYIIYNSFQHHKPIGFISIFLILSIYFYYGQYIVTLTDYSDVLYQKYISLNNGKIDNKCVIRAYYMLFRSLLVLYLGYYVYRYMKNSRSEGQNDLKDDIEIIIPRKYETISLIIFTISSICEFVVLARNATMGNYLELRAVDSEIYRFSSGNILFYFGYFSKWFLPSSMMLLILYALKKDKKYYMILLALSVFTILYVRTGARYMIVKMLFSCFIIHHYFYRRFTKRDFVVIVAFLLFTIPLMQILTVARAVGPVSIESISAETKNISSDLFFEILSTGGASISLANTLQYCPSLVDHQYFVFFYKMFANVLPTFLNPIRELSMTTTSSIFSPLLYNYEGNGYGSSFITEAYYSWGKYMYIYVFFFGFLLGYLQSKLDFNRKTMHIFGIFSSILLFSDFIYALRNDVFETFRSYLYCVVFPLFLITILSDRESYIINTKTSIKGNEKLN